jgi:hypothetical protein
VCESVHWPAVRNGLSGAHQGARARYEPRGEIRGKSGVGGKSGVEIRCRFIILARKDEPTLDNAPEKARELKHQKLFGLLAEGFPGRRLSGRQDGYSAFQQGAASLLAEITRLLAVARWVQPASVSSREA